MSRSRMSTSTSHEPRFRMRSFAAWNTAARLVALWALVVLVLHAVAASQNTATSSSHAGIRDREAAGCLTDCTPRFGIVSAFGNEAELLVAKTVDRREYRINGNVFTTGVLEANPVVIVLTGQSIENASMLTQLLIDHFRVHHLLLSGIAGGLSDANHIGDVVVPDKWSLPLEGYWNGSSEVPVPCGKAGDLSCVGEKLASVTSAPNSDFQVQTPAGPASTGLFMRDTFVMTAANSPQGEFKFDYAVDPEMLASRAYHQAGTRSLWSEEQIPLRFLAASAGYWRARRYAFDFPCQQQLSRIPHARAGGSVSRHGNLCFRSRGLCEQYSLPRISGALRSSRRIRQ